MRSTALWHTGRRSYLFLSSSYQSLLLILSDYLSTESYQIQNPENPLPAWRLPSMGKSRLQCLWFHQVQSKIPSMSQFPRAPEILFFCILFCRKQGWISWTSCGALGRWHQSLGFWRIWCFQLRLIKTRSTERARAWNLERRREIREIFFVLLTEGIKLDLTLWHLAVCKGLWVSPRYSGASNIKKLLASQKSSIDQNALYCTSERERGIWRDDREIREK